MSLTGNLEDLPLLDIIQIVSFSKKTGYLTIRNSAGEGAIVFDEGNVVAAFTWDSPPVDPRMKSLPEGKRNGLIRNRIEMALQQLIRLHEGQFSFSLSDTPPREVGARSIVEETLLGGINAQEVLIDLARGMDEDRRDSTAALEASFADSAVPEDTGELGLAAPPSDPEVSFADIAIEPAAPVPPPPPAEAEDDLLSELEPLPMEEAPRPAPPPAPAPPARPAARPAAAAPAPAPAPAPPSAELRTILLVDDEPDVRQILADHFREGGFEVVDAEDPDEALKKAGVLGKENRAFLLVTDLGMPASGGASFQGGFEVVKRLWKMNLKPPVLMMTESLSPALHARAKQMGISSFVFKPGLSKLDPEQFAADMRAFAAKLLKDVLPRLAHAGSGEKKPQKAAASAAPGPAPAARSDDTAREFAALQKHLEELRRPGQDATQISVLVMKVAREFFERGVLFVVKGEHVRGLGGFGLAPRGDNLNLLVRDISIPLSEPSVFQDIAQNGRTYYGALPEGKWSSHLMGRVGRFQSSQVAFLPLLAHRETIAILFGDNPDTGREVGHLEPLEVFVSQAGIALENAFLQRKLDSLQNR